ncbi:hypothetical protein CPB85DRAFT_1444223 [Mucidula mucida]|nr:hypothetical protein CPB85DRAFT_1444223 [Mucidula mucida]
MGPAIANDLYHIPVIRSIYTMKELPSMFDDMNNEILHALSVVLPQDEEQWCPIRPQEIAMDIVARASNRIFVGLPLCRNEEYLEINKQFALDVLMKASVLKMFPRFMRRLVSALFSNIEAKIKKVQGMIRDVVMEYKEHVQPFDTKFKEFEEDSPIKHHKLFIYDYSMSQAKKKLLFTVSPSVVNMGNMMLQWLTARLELCEDEGEAAYIYYKL